MKRRILREIPITVLAAAMGLGAFLIFEALLHALRGPYAGSELHGVVRAWMRERPGAWIVFGLLTAALSHPGRALFALRRRDDPASTITGELRVFAALGAASITAFASSVLVQIASDRLPTLNEAPRINPYSSVRLDHEMAMWTLLGSGMVLLAALWGLVGVLGARRESSRSAARITTIIGVAAVVIVTGVSLLRWWNESAGLGYNEEFMTIERRHAFIVASGDPLVTGRWALILVAMIAAVGILIAARREGPRPADRAETIASAGLFALGLVAFALTRGVAHDALHPLPPWDMAASDWLGDETVTALPVGEACTLGAEDIPYVVLDPDGRFRFQGSSWQTPAELQKAMENVKALWIQVQPSKRFPGRVEMVIPGATRIEVVAPIFAAARAAGYESFEVIEVLPKRSYTTRTLGEITYRPRVCHVPVPPRVELPRQGTWGELARTLPAP